MRNKSTSMLIKKLAHKMQHMWKSERLDFCDGGSTAGGQKVKGRSLETASHEHRALKDSPARHGVFNDRSGTYEARWWLRWMATQWVQRVLNFKLRGHAHGA